MVNEKLWIRLDTDVIKETTIFGEPGIVRITHFTKQTNDSPIIMLRGFIEVDEDKMDYIIPYKFGEFDV